MQGYNALLSNIKNNDFSPVYLLSGTEPYFIDQIVTQITQQLIAQGLQDFDHTIFYGKEIAVRQIVEAAKRFPMLAPYHLVVVKEAQYLTGDLEELAAYVKAPLKQTILVYCHKHGVIDKRKKFYKAAKQSGTAMEFKPLYDNQLAGWIQSRAKTFELKIPPQVCALMADVLGADLSRIENKLEKLKWVVKDYETVTPEMIADHVGFSKDFNNFELQKSIGLRQFSKSFQIIQYLSKNQKNNPITLTLSTLHSFFRKLLLFHGLDNSANASAILGVKPYFIKDYVAAARESNMKQTSAALQLIFEADLKSKGIGSSSKPYEILKELLVRIFAL